MSNTTAARPPDELEAALAAASLSSQSAIPCFHGTPRVRRRRPCVGYRVPARLACGGRRRADNQRVGHERHPLLGVPR
jgi:hypothetical protein